MTVSKKNKAKSKTKDDGHRITESYEILDGAAQVIRTTKSGKFWSISCWLREEKKCFRRSLHTKDLDEAKELARDKYFDLRASIKSGNRRFY